MAAADAGSRDMTTGALVPAPRAIPWTIRRLVVWVGEQFGLRCGRESIRCVLADVGMSWKKGKST